MPRFPAPAAIIAAAAIAVPALAEDVARLTFGASETDEGATISVKPEGGPVPATTASVAGGVLTLRFARPVEGDLSPLVAAAPRTVAAARFDPDGMSAKISLRRALSASVASGADGVKVVLAPTAAPEAAPASVERPAGRVTAGLTVGEREELTRLSFDFSEGAASVSASRTGDRVELRFSRAAEIDVSRLRTRPPRFVKAAERPSNAGGRLTIALTVAEGVRVRTFVENGRPVVDLLPPDPTAPKPVAAENAEPAAKGYVDPAPRGNVTPVEVVESADETQITVSWAGPARAAAFQRGEMAWMLFDSNARFQIRGGGRSRIQPVRGEGVTGFRVTAPPSARLSAEAIGNTWVFRIGPRRAQMQNAAVRRDVGVGGRGRLSIDFGAEGSVKKIADPIVGDTLAVALLAGPPRGVDGRRSAPDSAVLGSAHGAAVELRADGLQARFDAGSFVVSPRADMDRTPLEPVAPLQAISLLDLRREVAIPDDAVLDRKDELERRAASEGLGADARPEARLALARHLVAHGLAAEALGVMRLATVNQPQLESDPSFRLMRAAANVMMGRYQRAKADLDTGMLTDDPTAALWRGYILGQEGQYAEARRQIERGRNVITAQPREWRGRFELTLAQALAELEAFDEAATAAQRALSSGGPPQVIGHAQIVQARIAAAQGRSGEALGALRELENFRSEEVAARAAYEAARIERETGAEKPDTLQRLEALRLRWRGDALELAIIQQLGGQYAQLGRWREALVALRSGANRYPNHPIGRAMRDDMTGLFQRLFIDGEADRLEPIQALGLFYDFKELTPIGPSGDKLVRNLASRLVELDLLEQAEALLQYQVEQRLEGVSKAQIAADLAVIYLEDRKPEKALVALELSRQPRLPATLVAQRRVLEAKAHLDLGRTDHAMEILERDASPEAQSLRAEAAWRAKDWPRAAVELQKILATRPKVGPLDEADRGAVMRAAISLLFAADEKGVEALRTRYVARMNETPDAAAFDLVTSSPGTDAANAQLAEIAKSVARVDLLERFTQAMKDKMKAAPSPKA